MRGAIAQRLHCDTGSPAPALFTVFVALQDIDQSMGPTRFLLQTNTASAHRQFSADKTSFLNKAVSRVALLRAGDAVVYDSRVLHCGTENPSDKPRVLLVLTVQHMADESVDSATKRTERAYSQTKTLADFIVKKGCKPDHPRSLILSSTVLLWCSDQASCGVLKPAANHPVGTACASGIETPQHVARPTHSIISNSKLLCWKMCYANSGPESLKYAFAFVSEPAHLFLCFRMCSTLPDPGQFLLPYGTWAPREQRQRQDSRIWW